MKMAGVSTEDQYTEDALPHEWERMYIFICVDEGALSRAFGE